MNEKISLPPFSPETLEEGLVFFDSKEEWRKRYGKYICF
jgi:hypothetical protein